MGGGAPPPVPDGTVEDGLGVTVPDARAPPSVGLNSAVRVAATDVATCPGNVSVPDAGAFAVSSTLTVALRSGGASATDCPPACAAMTLANASRP